MAHSIFMNFLALACVLALPAISNAQGNHPLFSATIKSGESAVTSTAPVLENGMKVGRFAFPVKKGDAVLSMIKADAGTVQYELPRKGNILFSEKQSHKGLGGELFYNRFNNDDTLQLSVYTTPGGYSLAYKYRYILLSKEQLTYPVKGSFSDKLQSLLAGARFCYANWFYSVNRNIKDTTVPKGLFPNSVRTWIYGSTMDHIIAENLSKQAAATMMKKWIGQVDGALKSMPGITINYYSEQDMIAEGMSSILQLANYDLNLPTLSFIKGEWKPSPTTFKLMLKAEKNKDGRYDVAMYLRVQ
ncbi:MAG: hypothetical protein V4722_25590 [Bacteroidota bacterium]